MATTLDLDIITPGAVKFDGKAEIVVAPGARRRLGALPNHAPMLTTLRIGVLRATVVEGSARGAWSTPSTAASCRSHRTKCIVLTDVALAADEIDVEKTPREQKRAEEALAQKRGADDSAERNAVAWAPRSSRSLTNNGRWYYSGPPRRSAHSARHRRRPASRRQRRRRPAPRTPRSPSWPRRSSPKARSCSTPFRASPTSTSWRRCSESLGARVREQPGGTLVIDTASINAQRRAVCARQQAQRVVRRDRPAARALRPRAKCRSRAAACSDRARSTCTSSGFELLGASVDARARLDHRCGRRV